jgi:hypothetical protein
MAILFDFYCSKHLQWADPDGKPDRLVVPTKVKWRHTMLSKRQTIAAALAAAATELRLRYFSTHLTNRKNEKGKSYGC